VAYILPQSLQQGIQESLPVIPNNGNPSGANNMPAAEESQQAAPPDPYAWLKPSKYMDQVTEMLLNQDVLAELLQNIENPSQKQLYNPVFRNGELHTQPINDYGMPVGSDAYTYPVPLPERQLPQYVPILPGE
jgi:hypothetical protein